MKAASPRSIDGKLAALRGLALDAPDAAAKLRDALRSPSGVLVAAAAKVVAEHHLYAFAADFGPAFTRLCDDGVKRDPGCRGRVALVKALHALDQWDDAVFAAGLAVEQPEGWGGVGERDDTAAELRGLCGLAHAQFARPEALDVLAALLADPERVTRLAAAQGLGHSGRRDATALLRYKLLADREEEPEVLSACCEALIALAPQESLAFLASLLPAHDERAAAAALALGAARLADAYAPLAAWCAGALPAERRRIGYLALALLRAPAATEQLLETIRTDGRADALAAAQALATFRDDPVLAAQLRDAAAARTDAAGREIDALVSR
jgi:hypothetical protein